MRSVAAFSVLCAAAPERMHLGTGERLLPNPDGRDSTLSGRSIFLLEANCAFHSTNS
jgi:hypothetical protein